MRRRVSIRPHRVGPRVGLNFTIVLLTLPSVSISILDVSNHSRQAQLQVSFNQMIAYYLSFRAEIDTCQSEDPVDYGGIQTGLLRPELAQYALEILTCPIASVLSERAVSAADSFVTDSQRSQVHWVDGCKRRTYMRMCRPAAGKADVHAQVACMRINARTCR